MSRRRGGAPERSESQFFSFYAWKGPRMEMNVMQAWRVPRTKRIPVFLILGVEGAIEIKSSWRIGESRSFFVVLSSLS